MPVGGFQTLRCHADATYKHSVFQWFFVQPTQRVSLYYFRRIYTAWFLPPLFCRHDLFTLSFWQREIYLHIDKWICFSYFSLNLVCFEHTDFLPVISWFWKLYVPIWALPILAPTCFPEVICPRYDPFMIKNIYSTNAFV